MGNDVTLYTDGYKMNRTARTYGIRHAYVDHDSGEFVRGDIHTSGIEGFWGYLKRHLATTGGIRRPYFEDFIGEFVWRFNHRRLSRVEQEAALLSIL
jgi:transposase-like protein